jgi:ribosomal-protein-alanine N-acetyltransferase
MHEVYSINLERIELIPLSRDRLEIYLENEELFNRIVSRASREILTPVLQKAIRMKLDKLDQASHDDIPWITYWLIKVPPDGFGAGLIGFKGIPDQAGIVEIGYGIDPSFRNQGYMTEAVLALFKWAFGDPRCQQIIAPNTDRSNLASNRVLEKAGMHIFTEGPNTLSWCIEKERYIQNNE